MPFFSSFDSEDGSFTEKSKETNHHIEEILARIDEILEKVKKEKNMFGRDRRAVKRQREGISREISFSILTIASALVIMHFDE